MSMYEFDGRKPRVGKTSWVHETAQLIGDVIVGEECFIGAGAVLRGDFGTIRVGDRSSVQESCVMHSRPGQVCVIGTEVTVGHGTVLHGCEVKDRSVIGMGSVVSDGALVGENCIVSEGSVVRGKQKIPDGMLAAGNPAQVKGPLKDVQVMMKEIGTKAYVDLTKRYIETARKIEE